jgi:hypothetical protein
MNGIYILCVAIGVCITIPCWIMNANYRQELSCASGIWLRGKLPRLDVVILVALHIFWSCERVDAFFYEETKYIGPITGICQANGPNPSVHTEPNLYEKAANDKETSGGDPIPTISHLEDPSVYINRNIPLKSYRERLPWFVNSPGSFASFIRHIYQPFQVMGLFPIVSFACLQYGTAIAWLAILATTEASLFALPPYNFSTIAIGNLNIAPFIGFLFGSVFGGPINDWSIVRLARRNRGIYEPEMRLRLYIIPVLAMAAGLLMYGLTLAKVCQQSICEHFLGLTVSRECIGSCLPQAQG